jgi:hypothetical protein
MKMKKMNNLDHIGFNTNIFLVFFILICGIRGGDYLLYSINILLFLIYIKLQDIKNKND